MDALTLDGNAIAGLLAEIFAAEMTTATATCAGCGTAEPLGATRVYRGAGYVLRCPHCDTVLATLVEDSSEIRIALRGIRTLKVST